MQGAYCKSHHNIKLPKNKDSKQESNSDGSLVALEEEILASTAEDVILSSLDHVKMALIKIKDAYVKKVEKVSLADIINTVFDNLVELIEDGITDPDPEDNSIVSEESVTTEISKHNFAGSSYNKDVFEILNDLKLSSSHSNGENGSDDIDRQLKEEIKTEVVLAVANGTEEVTIGTKDAEESTKQSIEIRKGSLDLNPYYRWPNSFYYY